MPETKKNRVRVKCPRCVGRPREQKEGLVSSNRLLLAGCWTGSQGPAQQTYGHRVNEAVARPEWPSSRMLGALGRKLSSFLHLSESLRRLRGGGRTQKIQRKQIWLVQRWSREALCADRSPGSETSL